MEIQLDTRNKTITIEEGVNLHDFFEQINALLPDGRWREYTLGVSKIKDWDNPITSPYRTTQPWEIPTGIPGINTNPIWYTNDNNTIGGVLNFEFKTES